MSEKPEALRVADRLDLWGDQGDLLEAAAELRRLHAECDALRGTLKELRTRLHTKGRRPEECYEMSLIDAALKEAK